MVKFKGKMDIPLSMHIANNLRHLVQLRIISSQFCNIHYTNHSTEIHALSYDSVGLYYDFFLNFILCVVLKKRYKLRFEV